MGRRSNQPLIKVTINLGREDWEVNCERYHPMLDRSVVVRAIMREHFRRIEEQIEAQAPADGLKVDLNV